MKRVALIGTTLLALFVSVLFSQKENSDAAAISAKNKLGQISRLDQPIQSFGPLTPQISNDGLTIVCSYQGAICTIPRSGGTLTRLTSAEGYDVNPEFSPDGKRIAFYRSASGFGGDLTVIDAKSGKEQPLPKRITGVGKLEFHPDGQRVLGNFNAGGQGSAISWYDVKTGETQRLVSITNSRSRYALSHDGSRVVFEKTLDQRGRQGGDFGPQDDLFEISADGGEPEKIIRWQARAHDFCFSADDSSLILVSELGGGQAFYDLWEMPFDNPSPGAKKLTFGQADEHRPSTSADGRWLVYSENTGNTTALVVRDLETNFDQTVTVEKIDYRAATGQLEFATVDGKTDQPIVTRVSLEQQDGKYFAPVGSLYRVLKSYGHFYCNEAETLTLPAGTYNLRAYRGPEYAVAAQIVEIQANETTSLIIPVNRWTHQASKGWYSGENHIHANYGYGEWYNSPETMLAQCAGEDLNICNFMVANSDTDGVFDRRFFRGAPDPISTGETILYWNQEFRSTIWGHMTLVNLSQLVEPIFTGFNDTTNPFDIPTNSDIADKTHLQNGLVNYTHVAQNPDDPYQNPYTGKSIPIDVALGKIDSLDLNSSYAGTVPLWYSLLNCGFRVAGSAGTDCFLNRVVSRLPGGDRVYVKTDGPLNYEKWIAGLKAGRSFVTNGPMLEFTASGKELGDTIRLASAGKVSINATASSAFPLDAVEIIYNGKIIASGKLTGEKRSSLINQKITIEGSGWLALRASGKPHRDTPVSTLYAHTSPIYINVADKPYRSASEARKFLKWIDRLSLAVRLRDRIPSDELKRHVENQFTAARKVYRDIVENGD